jgi:hypothetical protein
VPIAWISVSAEKFPDKYLSLTQSYDFWIYSYNAGVVIGVVHST